MTLTNHAPVYIKCAPQSDGSAIIDADNPFVQVLPSTADGKIYIFLGIASGAETVELVPAHPIYCYRNGAIRLWTGNLEKELPSITESDDGKVLGVINGAWGLKEDEVEEVFIAEYGVTTNAEIYAAFQAKKVVVYYASGTPCYLRSCSASYADFESLLDASGQVIDYIVQNNSWERFTDTYAKSSAVGNVVKYTAQSLSDS